MTGSRDLRDELQVLLEELCFCMRHCLPSRQFAAELILGGVQLGLLEKQLIRASGLEERRKAKKELEEGMRILRQGLEILWQARTGWPPESLHQALHWGGLMPEEAPSPPLAG